MHTYSPTSAGDGSAGNRYAVTLFHRLLHKPQDAGGFSALGWGYLPSFLGRRGPALFHAGSDGNWTSVVMLFCQTGNGVLVASNAYQSMGGERVVHETMRAIVPLIAEVEPVAAK